MKSMLWKRVRRQGVPDRERGIVIGIDVSKGKMDLAAFNPEGGYTRTLQLSQDRAGFETLRKLIEEFQSSGHEVWIAFEPTGPYSTCLRDWLFESDFQVVQANPYHVHRTKEVRDNSPLKTDGKDPRVISDLVWQGCYQEVHPLPPVYAELRAASFNWKALSQEKTRLKNRFQSLLEEWFPELARFFRNKVCKTIRALVRNYPSPSALGGSSLQAVRTLVKEASHGKKSPQVADEIWRAAQVSIGTHLGRVHRYLHLCRVLRQLDAMEVEEKILRKQLEALLRKLPEREYLFSVSGVKAIIVACLLGECGPLGRYESYARLEKFVGLNLFEVSSGQYRGGRHISKRGRSIARWALCQAATLQTKKDGLYVDYARGQKKKGQAWRKVQVAIARKLLELLYALVRDGAKFDRRKFTERRAGDGRVHLQGTQLKPAA